MDQQAHASGMMRLLQPVRHRAQIVDLAVRICTITGQPSLAQPGAQRRSTVRSPRFCSPTSSTIAPLISATRGGTGPHADAAAPGR